MGGMNPARRRRFRLRSRNGDGEREPSADNGTLTPQIRDNEEGGVRRSFSRRAHRRGDFNNGNENQAIISQSDIPASPIAAS